MAAGDLYDVLYADDPDATEQQKLASALIRQRAKAAAGDIEGHQALSQLANMQVGNFKDAFNGTEKGADAQQTALLHEGPLLQKLYQQGQLWDRFRGPHMEQQNTHMQNQDATAQQRAKAYDQMVGIRQQIADQPNFSSVQTGEGVLAYDKKAKQPTKTLGTLPPKSTGAKAQKTGGLWFNEDMVPSPQRMQAISEGKLDPTSKEDVDGRKRIQTLHEAAVQYIPINRDLQAFLKRHPNGLIGGDEATQAEVAAIEGRAIAMPNLNMKNLRGFDLPVLDAFLSNPTKLKEILSSEMGIKNLALQAAQDDKYFRTRVAQTMKSQGWLPNPDSPRHLYDEFFTPEAQRNDNPNAPTQPEKKTAGYTQQELLRLQHLANTPGPLQKRAKAVLDSLNAAKPDEPPQPAAQPLPTMYGDAPNLGTGPFPPTRPNPQGGRR